MISRCPSCAAEVDDESRRCPHCHWDFAELRKIAPGETPPPPPPLPQEEKTSSASADVPPPPLPEPTPPAPKRPSPKPSAPMPVEDLASGKAFTDPEVPASVPARPAGFSNKQTMAGAILAGVVLVVAAAVVLLPGGRVSRRRAAAPVVSASSPAPIVAARVSSGTAVIAKARVEPQAEPKNAARPEPAKVVEPPPEPVAAAKPRWVFEGRVYDLVTLQSVYAADLVFRDASGQTRGETSTGDEGRYRVVLEPLAGGYTMTPKHADFQGKYFDEISPPFEELSAEERRQLASSVGRGKPWIGKTGGVVRRDFVMIPRLIDDAPSDASPGSP